LTSYFQKSQTPYVCSRAASIASAHSAVFNELSSFRLRADDYPNLPIIDVLNLLFTVRPFSFPELVTCVEVIQLDTSPPVVSLADV
jgi:hypothetical protein